MKYQIKHRWTSEVIFECELEARFEKESASIQLGAAVKLAVKEDANLAGANLEDANLADANLAGAYLARAYLAGANLARADLARAYLAHANLAGANLAGANLVRANLAGANLAGANLARAYLAGAKRTATPEEVERLDKVREIILSKPERLNMNTWHSGEWTPEHTPEEEHSCGSAHCIAGWIQALHPDPAVRQRNAQEVGRELCPSASHMFFTSDAVARQWLKDRAYAPEAA